MAREHPAVQETRQQILRGVDALCVGEPHQSGHPATAVEIPSDVGPTVEVGRRVADMDHCDHAETRRRGPHAIPRRVPRRHATRRAPVDGVEKERPCPEAACPLELGDCSIEVGEVDHRYRV